MLAHRLIRDSHSLRRLLPRPAIHFLAAFQCGGEPLAGLPDFISSHVRGGSHQRLRVFGQRGQVIADCLSFLIHNIRFFHLFSDFFQNWRWIGAIPDRLIRGLLDRDVIYNSFYRRDPFGKIGSPVLLIPRVDETGQLHIAFECFHGDSAVFILRVLRQRRLDVGGSAMATDTLRLDNFEKQILVRRLATVMSDRVDEAESASD